MPAPPAAPTTATAATSALRRLGKALGDGGKLTATLGAVTEQDDDHATAAYTARWQLPGLDAPWAYDGSAAADPHQRHLDRALEPADLHPKLTAAGLASLRVEHVLPDRAALEDAAGTPLFAKTDVVTVGVQPSKVTDLPGLAATLAGVLKIDAADIVADVKKASPNAFVP